MTPHEESLLLARGCETWRTMAERWIGIAIDLELRLLAAQRLMDYHRSVIEQQASLLDQLRTNHAAVCDELQTQRELWQRCAARLMDV